ncbi:MAG: DUF1330 domain-containing protein [Saprospiraceae bacterium]|nr:DUF1330 domain-containing protein [Saprospiraceae bacterium]
MNSYIHPTENAGKAFLQAHVGKGSVIMLNLLRFKSRADYDANPDLAPAHPLSGKDAYNLYMKLARPLIQKAGSRVIFYGETSDFLIGPTSESWDRILLVEHQSAERFVAFAQDPEYLAIAGHRTAALEDSRLLPIAQKHLI